MITSCDDNVAGPTDSSLEDFWLMVCQENVDVVVMLTMTFEEGEVGVF